jgi:hypothetical protein
MRNEAWANATQAQPRPISRGACAIIDAYTLTGKVAIVGRSRCSLLIREICSVLLIANAACSEVMKMQKREVGAQKCADKPGVMR